jgi:lipopolysaccharide/colanic/teichoic acid biosynthesis glycosyltransferase
LAIQVNEPSLKRPFDFILSTFGIVISSPLWLIVAVAIKLEDGGPVYFAQKRWGRSGSVINVKKFRTMIPDADNKQAEEFDSRITKVGKVLRAMGIDELPQLLSIWRGDMSLVGPRPLAIDEIVSDDSGQIIKYEDIPGFWERLSIRPGLTGISTIYKSKDIHPRRKFRYDLFYIRNQSFWLDVKLVILSLWISIRGKWETRGKKI